MLEILRISRVLTMKGMKRSALLPRSREPLAFTLFVVFVVFMVHAEQIGYVCARTRSTSGEGCQPDGMTAQLSGLSPLTPIEHLAKLPSVPCR